MGALAAEEAEFQRPIDKVRDALPGTIGELVAATGYPAGNVIALIIRLRSEGVRVNAAMNLSDPGYASTVYTVEGVA